MQKSATVALLVSTASTINLEFSDMPTEFNQDHQFIQTVALSAASSRSGVRAKWTELPNCMKWCNFLDETTGKPLEPAGDGQPAGLYIPLRDDLANAIIPHARDQSQDGEPTFALIQLLQPQHQDLFQTQPLKSTIQSGRPKQLSQIKNIKLLEWDKPLTKHLTKSSDQRVISTLTGTGTINPRMPNGALMPHTVSTTPVICQLRQPLDLIHQNHLPLCNWNSTEYTE